MGDSIDKKELVKRLAKRLSKDSAEIEPLIDATFEEIYQALKREERVSIRNFSTFYIQRRVVKRIRRMNIGTKKGDAPRTQPFIEAGIDSTPANGSRCWKLPKRGLYIRVRRCSRFAAPPTRLPKPSYFDTFVPAAATLSNKLNYICCYD